MEQQQQHTHAFQLFFFSCYYFLQGTSLLTILAATSSMDWFLSGDPSFAHWLFQQRPFYTSLALCLAGLACVPLSAVVRCFPCPCVRRFSGSLAIYLSLLIHGFFWAAMGVGGHTLLAAPEPFHKAVIALMTILAVCSVVGVGFFARAWTAGSVAYYRDSLNY